MAICEPMQAIYKPVQSLSVLLLNALKADWKLLNNDLNRVLNTNLNTVAFIYGIMGVDIANITKFRPYSLQSYISDMNPVDVSLFVLDER